MTSTPYAPKGISKTSLLLVEGKDESNFLGNMLEHLGINDVQIIEVGGKDNFNLKMRGVSKVDNFHKVRRMGFVRDAEENAAHSAFASITHTLKGVLNELGAYDSWELPDKPGKIADKAGYKIGTFIMPNNIDAGMLEGLCLEAVREHPSHGCVLTFIECLAQREGTATVEIRRREKRHMLAFLAAVDSECYSLGVAAKKRIWPFNNECFQPFGQFLHELFVD